MGPTCDEPIEEDLRDLIHHPDGTTTEAERCSRSAIGTFSGEPFYVTEVAPPGPAGHPTGPEGGLAAEPQGFTSDLTDIPQDEASFCKWKGSGSQPFQPPVVDLNGHSNADVHAKVLAAQRSGVDPDPRFVVGAAVAWWSVRNSEQPEQRRYAKLELERQVAAYMGQLEAKES